MGGGSGLNLIYEDMLDKMHVNRTCIEQSNTTFRGIIPSREARCSGRITLDVLFGTPENYRSKELLFYVVPFNSGYHAILGWDALSRFQAMPPLWIYEAQNSRGQWYNHNYERSG